MQHSTARINTHVPARLKARIDKLADSYGLKSADVIRIALRYSVDRFEANGIELTKSADNKKPGGPRYAR